jgi:hypothetical protein
MLNDPANGSRFELLFPFQRSRCDLAFSISVRKCNGLDRRRRRDYERTGIGNGTRRGSLTVRCVVNRCVRRRAGYLHRERPMEDSATWENHWCCHGLDGSGGRSWCGSGTW